MDFLNTCFEFFVHSLRPATAVLPQPSLYLMLLRRQPLLNLTVTLKLKVCVLGEDWSSSAFCISSSFPIDMSLIQFIYWNVPFTSRVYLASDWQCGEETFPFSYCFSCLVILYWETSFHYIEPSRKNLRSGILYESNPDLNSYTIICKTQISTHEICQGPHTSHGWWS